MKKSVTTYGSEIKEVDIQDVIDWLIDSLMSKYGYIDPEDSITEQVKEELFLEGYVDVTDEELEIISKAVEDNLDEIIESNKKSEINDIDDCIVDKLDEITTVEGIQPLIYDDINYLSDEEVYEAVKESVKHYFNLK